MGNAPTRYMSNAEAAVVLGGTERWNELRGNLERTVGKYIDFTMFCELIWKRFEKIPKLLCESIFRAFAADTSKRVEVDVFLSSYAALEAPNHVLNCRFLFRVYENEFSSGGVLQRKYVEDLLRLAYGERLKAHFSAVQHLLEAMFGRTATQELSLKDLEGLNIKLDILIGWVRTVLQVFAMTGGRRSRLYTLERKYSAQLEAKTLMATYRFSRPVCDDLRRRFLHLCSSSANNPSLGTDGAGEGAVQVMNISMRAELQLAAWLRSVSGQNGEDNGENSVSYLNETLAAVIYRAQTDAFKPKWRFLDFANFCAIFGGGDLSLQARTVTDAFIQCALTNYYADHQPEGAAQDGAHGVRKSAYSAEDGPLSSCSSDGRGGRDEGNISSPGSSDLSSPFAQLSSPVADIDTPLAQDAPDSADVYVLNALNNMILTLACPASSVRSSSAAKPGTAELAACPPLSRTLHQALVQLNREVEPESCALSYTDFILRHYAALPGMRDLGLAACCRFGYSPASPLRQMEFITELSLRHLQCCPQSSAHPYGPVGTEWCLLPKAWYDTWRVYVGHQHLHDGTDTSGGMSPTAQASKVTEITATIADSLLGLDGIVQISTPPPESSSGRATAPTLSSKPRTVSSGSLKRTGPPPPRPGPVDNAALLKKAGVPLNVFKSNSSGKNRERDLRQNRLLPQLVCGRDVEVVSPAVYDALIAWYGGGPPIVRKVVACTASDRKGDTPTSRTSMGLRLKDTVAASELELYPLSLTIVTCDNAGNTNSAPLCEGILFSKTSTVQDIATFLCGAYTVELSRIRLWNYAQPGREHWKEQYILSPELTLQRANIQDNQSILIEVSLLDGSWPRSLLHAALDSEERALEVSSARSTTTDAVAEACPEASVADILVDLGVTIDEYTGAPAVQSSVLRKLSAAEEESAVAEPMVAGGIPGQVQGAVSSLSAAVGSVLGGPFPSSNAALLGERKFSARTVSLNSALAAPVPAHKRNSGLVGMDNLGNTCYMNSSLQALLHTEPLAEYFLSKAYLRHLNLHSTHGFKGRLANSFGRLAHEMWSTSADCVTPRFFKHDIANLHEQFSGNEQHDAHELLAFLLDGLSEDLNLVYDKPYTEQPDSDGRSDAVLADIWWANHLKRDRSVMQALFSGQFKSVMSCSTPGCGYSSARFEPFNFLSVPVPEETERIIGVTVVPLWMQHTVYCEVRVAKDGTMQDIVNRVLELGLAGLTDSGSDSRANSPRKSPAASSSAGRIRNSPRGKGIETAARRGTGTGTGTAAEVFFQAGELVHNRIKSFNSMERRVDTVRDTECLILFQVRRPAGDIVLPTPASSPSVIAAEQVKAAGESGQNNESALNQVAVEPAPVHASTTRSSASSINQPPKPAIFDPESLYQTKEGPYNNSDRFVRVALCQRRVRMRDVALSGAEPASDTAEFGAGTEYFQLESFGVSALEVVPNKMRCSDLYRLVARKYAPFLKVPVRSLIRHRQLQRQQQQQQLRHTTSGSSLSSMSAQQMPNSGGAAHKGESGQAAAAEEYPVNIRLDRIATADTDEVIGGAIPEEGFTLRLIGGGLGATATCSRCPWLQHCEGCVLPDHDEVDVELRDGESLAVDWHFVVFEDLLDTQAMCAVQRHSSASSNNKGQNSSSNYISTPLQRCLDKFTEQEKLEGVVCPRCKHSEGNISKSFTLWRLPPVLIVQLKRFQFDHTSRRKLNNHIDFPFEDLDLFDYLAGTRKRSLSTASQADLGATDCASPVEGSDAPNETVENNTALAMAALYGDTSEADSAQAAQLADSALAAEVCGSDSPCTRYDLYSVIHHAGALGGGHYATTARTLSTHPNAGAGTSQSSHGSGNNGNNGKGNSAAEALDAGAWYCYNDNIVSKVSDARDICCSSAYVLFYLRQDMRRGDVLALLRSQLTIPAVTPTAAETVSSPSGVIAEEGSKTTKSVEQEPPVAGSKALAVVVPPETTPLAARAEPEHSALVRPPGVPPPPAKKADDSHMLPKPVQPDDAVDNASATGGCVPS